MRIKGGRKRGRGSILLLLLLLSHSSLPAIGFLFVVPLRSRRLLHAASCIRHPRRQISLEPRRSRRRRRRMDAARHSERWPSRWRRRGRRGRGGEGQEGVMTSVSVRVSGVAREGCKIQRRGTSILAQCRWSTGCIRRMWLLLLLACVRVGRKSRRVTMMMAIVADGGGDGRDIGASIFSGGGRV